MATAQAIAATPGVYVIMLGLADSILSGFPGQLDHPRIAKSIDKVAAAARNTGKHWAIVVVNAEHARNMLEMGARLLFHNADIVIIKNALLQMQEQFASLGITYEGCLNLPSRR